MRIDLLEMGALEESASRDMLLAFLQSGVAVHNADLSWEERDIILSGRNLLIPISADHKIH
jgi:replicative superfamily II helicase